MRPIPLMTALTASLLLAGAAVAAPARTVAAAPVMASPPAPPADEEPLPPIAEDQAQADAMNAQLAALDARIGADEQRITQLRDAELLQENARIRAIQPALPLTGESFLPHWL